jgi:hypothetical protein
LVYPGADIRDRIHKNLVQEWEQTRVAAKPDGILQRWWRSISGNSWSTRRQNQRVTTFALAGIGVLALVFLAVVTITNSQTLPASAEGDLSFGVVAVGLGILVAAAAFFFSKRG